MHAPFAEVMALSLHLCNERLSGLLHALFRRHIDREPWLSLVVLLVHEALLALVQSEENDLRNVQVRVVLRNDVFFSGVEDVLTNHRLDISERDLCQ